MSYEQSQQTRQAILDHLHANPLKSANQLALALGKTRSSVQSCVKFMAGRYELEKIGNGNTTCYRALVTTTISAKDLIAEMQQKRRSAGKNEVTKENGKTRAPGYYSQRGGNWDPHDGRGQGSLRRTFGIQSGLA